MDQPNDPFATALKMIEATNPQAAKTVRLWETLEILRKEPGDEQAAMALLGQLNPKYAPYVQLIRSMNGVARQNEENAAVKSEAEPFVQYNHPQEGE